MNKRRPQSRQKPSGDRRRLADPHLGQPLAHRLERSGAVDLRNNYVRVPLGNGYSVILPVDSTKRFRTAT
jgi:hypothetical protein